VFYLVGVVGKFIVFILCFLVFLMVCSCHSHFTECVIFFSLTTQKQPLEVALYYPIFFTLLETFQHNCVYFYSFQASCVLCPLARQQYSLPIFMRICVSHTMELELAAYIRIAIFLFVFKSSLGSRCKK